VENNYLYSVFIIDPPYPKKKGGLRKTRPNQDRKLDYETMSMDEIFALLETNIFSVAMPEHAVFMWTIDQFLIDTEQRMEALGYKRHCRFIWDKTNGVAPAFTVRYSHEYLIWFYKPSMIKIEFDMRGKFTTVFTEKAREHSRKPEYAYDMIEKLYKKETKLDVFSREKREGWSQFGNQPDYFDEPKKEKAELMMRTCPICLIDTYDENCCTKTEIHKDNFRQLTIF
jgi:N6-adenosine-specific RNA methylase IME4